MKLYKDDVVNVVTMKRGKPTTIRKERLSGTRTYYDIDVIRVDADEKSRVPSMHIGSFGEGDLITITDPAMIQFSILFHRPWYNRVRALFNI